MLEIKIQNHCRFSPLSGGFKRRTERCDRYCTGLLQGLKLIQGLNHSKTGGMSDDHCLSCTETRA